MKRVFTFILVVCTLLLLAACGNNSQPDSVCEHTFDQWVVEKQATCKEEGLLTRSCTKCDYMEATKIEKTNDHTEVIDPEVPATCEKTGLSEGKHCAVCGKVFVSQQETPIVAHTYDDKYDESCNVCGHIRDAECAHKETEVIAGKAATCTEIGLTEGSKCKKCGEILVAQTALPVIDHTESDWIVDKKATKTEDGKKHTECTVCGARIAEDSIPATGSVGLSYTLNSDEKSYAVTIGSCADTDVVIPAKYKGLPVTAIGVKAFYACASLTSVTIGDSVTTIGDYAFYNCAGLTSVTIGDSVTSIGRGAFSGCDSLQSITIPDSVTSIGDGAFSICESLQSISIPDSVTSIDGSAFYYCASLQSITIGDSVTSIGDWAFCGCGSLQSITIPDSVTSIGEWVFASCGRLQSITIPDSVTSIGERAFSNCTSLQSITIPDSVTSIGNYAFYGCDSLQSVTIPDSVTSIGLEAFSSCRSLQSVTIPDSVTSIGNDAFRSCDSLQSITYEGTVAQWKNIKLGKDWNYNIPATEVICSNGSVSLK